MRTRPLSMFLGALRDQKRPWKWSLSQMRDLRMVSDRFQGSSWIFCALKQSAPYWVASRTHTSTRMCSPSPLYSSINPASLWRHAEQPLFYAVSAPCFSLQMLWEWSWRGLDTVGRIFFFLTHRYGILSTAYPFWIDERECCHAYIYLLLALVLLLSVWCQKKLMRRSPSNPISSHPALFSHSSLL